MVRVEQLMTRDLACVEATQAVSVAANLMRIRKIGSLLVKRGEELVGIVTESDIVRKVVAFHLSPEFIHVEQIMSSPIVSIDESESIFEAAGIMQAAHTRHLVVGNESHVFGMLSVRDLLAPVAKDEL
ncbi:MAG: CBS domain-containing protein [Nitrospirales bacterium]|nr:CBS domain-containing protein [Nitrospirales bacterium]